MRISGKLCAFALCVFIVGIAYAETTDADKKTVASKAYVDTKQDKIATEMVDLYGDGEYMLPAITTYDITSGLVGNKIGILDMETIADAEGGLIMYNDDNYENGEMDNFVPTVRAVANALQSVYWSPLTWDSAETTSTNAYDITFVGDTGATANAWPRTDKNELVNTAALAQGLALKQNKLPAKDTSLVLGQQVGNNIPSSVLAPTTAGNVTQVALWDADALDLTAWNINELSNDNAELSAIRQSIPTVGAVEVGLNAKQNKMTCAGWDSDTHTDEHCWLWSIAE